MQTANDCDVIVIGAGIAGLTAARLLLRQGLDVRVFEARDRVGGRTYSQALGNDTIDLGGQWIGAGQERVLALADELGVRSFPQYNRGKRVLVFGEELRTYRGLFPKMSVLALIETVLNMGRLSLLSASVPLAQPGKAAGAARWDELTAEDWLQRNIFTREADGMLRLAIQMIFAAEPREISFLYFLCYLHSGGGLQRLVEIDNGAQQARMVGGAQQLSIRMAEELGAGRVQLACPVTAIQQTEQGVTATAVSASFIAPGAAGPLSGGSRVVRAPYAILAVPPALLKKIEFAPELPPARQQLRDRMPMGSVIKCVVAYERPFWREQGFSGEALFSTGPVRALFDDCAHDLSQAALVAFIIGAPAHEYTLRTPDERRQAVIEQIARVFGLAALKPTAYIDHDWLHEEWSGGCYTGLMGPGLLSEAGATLREPWGRVHFAGTETAVHWRGYFDGAVESGERAADEILSRRV
jgi:monoamine oxidase